MNSHRLRVLIEKLKVLIEKHQSWNRRQCSRVVRAPDLISGGPGFKSRSNHYLELCHGRPEFYFSATLVNSQLACLLLIGIFSPVIVQFEIFVSNI